MNGSGIEIERFVTLEAPRSHPEVCDATALFYTYGRKSAAENWLSKFAYFQLNWIEFFLIDNLVILSKFKSLIIDFLYGL